MNDRLPPHNIEAEETEFKNQANRISFDLIGSNK